MLRLSSPQITAQFLPFGARLVSLGFDGVDVTAGAGTEADLRSSDFTAGAVCGRHAGRIRNSSFSLDGRRYELVPNMGPHQLHGGPNNFACRPWQVEKGEDFIRFSLVSEDGDQGFPGEVRAAAVYRLEEAILSLDLEAATSRPTVINLTNHGYWNLAGGGSVLSHELMISSDQFLPLDEQLLPSGEIRQVAGSRWDFRQMRRIAEVYDNCWLLRGGRGVLKQALTLRDPLSGRRLEVWATEGAVQLYTANHWTAAMPGKTGPLQPHGGFAIETQNAPDAINHEDFPSAVLRPGEIYRHRTEWRFSKT